jgi:hypothetical protein
MKPISLRATLVALFASGAVVFAEAPAMTDAPTYAQVVAARRRAEQADPMKRMAPSNVENPVVNRPKDILKESDVLCFQGLATLVPKRAILKIPKNYQNRVGIQPGARIVGWRDFYAVNRGWITTVEVNWKQAAGALPIAADTRNLLERGSNLSVATFQGGPISVMPPKETANTTASTR